jgi:hypothetical protein
MTRPRVCGSATTCNLADYAPIGVVRTVYCLKSKKPGQIGVR